MKKGLTILFLCLALTPLIGCFSEESGAVATDSSGAVLVTFNGREEVVDLYGNASAADFASLLPLTLLFDDYNASEKTATLPNGRRLDTADAPAGYDPNAGELGYYAPWGNVVIYHRDFGYAAGIVPLGRFRSGADIFTAISGEVTVAFERLP